MYVTFDQPRTAIICLFIGEICGLVYEPFSLLKSIINKKLINHVLNFTFLFLSAFIYTLMTAKFSLGNFRLYMAVFFLLGLILYLNSFHKIIAFFIIRVYNVFIRKIKRVVKRLKDYNDRPKKEKGIFRLFGGRGDVFIRSSYRSRLSSGRHTYKKKSNRTS